MTEGNTTSNLRVYVASSWRNPLQPSTVALLREFGHEVYDFRNPTANNTGFHWSECIPGVDARKIDGYLEVIRSERATEGFKFDKGALDWCDVCVLLLPCGRSAHLEAGYAAGQGKKVYVLLSDVQFEPELMYLLCTGITDKIEQVLEWLQKPVQPGVMASDREWREYDRAVRAADETSAPPAEPL